VGEGSKGQKELYKKGARERLYAMGTKNWQVKEVRRGGGGVIRGCG